MTNDITNAVLLEHMQGMKYELQTEIRNSKAELQSELRQQISRLEAKVDRGFEGARMLFEDARKHREALQEDLDASIRMLAKHDRKLARL